MSQFLCKALLFRASSQVSLQNPSFSSPRIRWFSVCPEDDKENSFPVSYLKTTLGFSPEMALSISKSVKFDSPDKPDKAIDFFRSNGFSQTQISKLVRTCPAVLLADSQKTILPKLEFLKSKGLSELEIAKMLPRFPTLLKSSLKDKIKPSYDYLRRFLKSDKRTINAVRRYPDILCSHFGCVVANFDVFREHGVSDSNIALCLERRPRSFASRSDRLRGAIEGVAEMGFDSSKGNFCEAAMVSLGLSESTRERKFEALRVCGFSEEEASRLFRSFPNVLKYSVGNISATMKFFAGEIGCGISLVLKCPSVLGLSLEKRIIPRCAVYKALLEKGLVVDEKKDGLNRLLMVSEERFLEKYVEPYENSASELLKLYREKLKGL